MPLLESTRVENGNQCFYYRKLFMFFFSFYLYMVLIRHVLIRAERSGQTYIVPIDDRIIVPYSLFTHGLDRPYSNLEKLIVSIVASVVFVVGTFVFVNVHP